MAIPFRNVIILCTCLMNYMISNALESQSNTGYTLVIRAMYMWQLKQNAIEPCFFLFLWFSCNPVDKYKGNKNLHGKNIAANLNVLNTDTNIFLIVM